MRDNARVPHITIRAFVAVTAAIGLAIGLAQAERIESDISIIIAREDLKNASVIIRFFSIYYKIKIIKIHICIKFPGRQVYINWTATSLVDMYRLHENLRINLINLLLHQYNKNFTSLYNLNLKLFKYTVFV